MKKPSSKKLGARELAARASVMSRIWKHYNHAKKQHPYFCDMITCLSRTGADTHLDLCRRILKVEADNGCVGVDTVLMCEFYGGARAYAHGNTAHAVEECFDAIAVLLRTIDVLEGRQKLGKPGNVHTKPKKGKNK